MYSKRRRHLAFSRCCSSDRLAFVHTSQCMQETATGSVAVGGLVACGPGFVACAPLPVGAHRCIVACYDGVVAGLTSPRPLRAGPSLQCCFWALQPLHCCPWCLMHTTMVGTRTACTAMGTATCTTTITNDPCCDAADAACRTAGAVQQARTGCCSAHQQAE